MYRSIYKPILGLVSGPHPMTLIVTLDGVRTQYVLSIDGQGLKQALVHADEVIRMAGETLGEPWDKCVSASGVVARAWYKGQDESQAIPIYHVDHLEVHQINI